VWVDLNKEILQANILIVDDEPANVTLLKRYLQREGYQNIHTTTDPREVNGLCDKTDFDAFLLDIRMPEINGFELMAWLNKRYSNNNYLPILVLTAQTDQETRIRALNEGAKDFLTKPFDRIEALTRIHNLIEVHLMHQKLKQQNVKLEEKVKQRTKELYHTRQQVIRRLGLAAEYRDNETGNHIIRMSKYSYLFALAIGLTEKHAELILNAAPMHDIGKIGIPDRVLLKPDKLNAEEWKVMQSHVMIGVEILSGDDSELMLMAKRIALHHHEKWDGTGYPAGLKGEEISIEGRICAIADVFDALLSIRPYKKSWTVDQTINLIESEAGKHFDPQIAQSIRLLLPELLKIKEQFPDDLEEV